MCMRTMTSIRLEYQGGAAEEEFERQIMKASAHVRRITFGRADSCPEMEEVKFAACAVCDMLIADGKIRENNSGRQIVSESTDGYSVSYVQEKEADETSEALLTEKLIRRQNYIWNQQGFCIWGWKNDHQYRSYDLSQRI